jgi:uncharacterized RDD family membrane protein YckC
VQTPDGVLEPAGFQPRFMAFLLDGFILFLLLRIFAMVANVPEPTEQEAMGALNSFMRDFDPAVLEALGPPPWALVLSSTICGAYYTLFHAFGGASLGKMALGLTVRHQDGRTLTLGMAFARYVFYWFAAKLIYTAWWIPIDREKRTLYDVLLKLNVFRVVR